MGFWTVKSNPSLWRWLLVVLTVALLVRAGLWFNYPLAESNDTPTYRHLARSLGNNGFERYNGTRTPAYPFFILATRSDATLYAIQLLLGVYTTLLVFYLAWTLSRRAWFAGLMALFHTLNLGQLFFEAALLTEALATFFLFGLLAGLAWLWTDKTAPPGKQLGITALLGLAAAALALTRPLFFPVAFWGALFLAFLWRTPWKTRWAAAVLLALPTVLVLGLWVNFIYGRFKILGLDSMGGYHLVNHTTSFFERAPDEYASIRDTFVEFRAQRLAESGSGVNTIWDAIPTLMEQEKLNYYALGRRMGEISNLLIRENPGLYAQNLALGWWWFWRVGVFWLPNTLANPLVRSALSSLMWLERLALFGANMIFLAGSLALLWSNLRARLQPPLFIWFAVSAVWVTSVLQTLAEHGDNARFLAPMQTLVVVLVAWGILQLPKPRTP